MNKAKTVTTITSLLFSLCLMLAVTADAYGDEYEALKGVESIKGVVDFRMASPKSAAFHLKVIHQTFKDKNILAVDKQPDFAVIFIGPSVKLISRNREGFGAEDTKSLDEIAAIISEMSKDGVKLEVCLIAARAMGVDPASVLPEIKRVPNGWISQIGYQAKGYSLIPDY